MIKRYNTHLPSLKIGEVIDTVGDEKEDDEDDVSTCLLVVYDGDTHTHNLKLDEPFDAPDAQGRNIDQ
jgi:hypothetical protein